MPNPGLTLGQITELTIVTPITAGQVELLRTTLQTLNTQRIWPGSPQFTTRTKRQTQRHSRNYISLIHGRRNAATKRG